MSMDSMSTLQGEESIFFSLAPASSQGEGRVRGLCFSANVLHTTHARPHPTLSLRRARDSESSTSPLRPLRGWEREG